MQTAVQKKFLVLAGLIILSLVVLATGAQIVNATVVAGAGAPSGGSAASFAAQFQGLTAARVAQHQQYAPPAESSASSLARELRGLTAARVAQHQQHAAAAVAALSRPSTAGTALAGTQGRGGVNASATAPAPVKAAVSTSTTSSSRTTWIIVGAVIAALAIIAIAWAFARRRRPSAAAGPGSEAFCALHPEDALCGSA